MPNLITSGTNVTGLPFKLQYSTVFSCQLVKSLSLSARSRPAVPSRVKRLALWRPRVVEIYRADNIVIPFSCLYSNVA